MKRTQRRARKRLSGRLMRAQRKEVRLWAYYVPRSGGSCGYCRCCAAARRGSWTIYLPRKHSPPMLWGNAPYAPTQPARRPSHRTKNTCRKLHRSTDCGLYRELLSRELIKALWFFADEKMHILLYFVSMSQETLFVSSRAQSVDSTCIFAADAAIRPRQSLQKKHRCGYFFSER